MHYLAVGDPDRFEQALWAVLDNAVKYSPSASAISVTVSPISEHSSRSRSPMLGRGMTPRRRPRAFDQFYRSPDARAVAPDGSGIGLYTARGLLRAMDGDIALSSKLGAGTTLTLRLPGERADADPT